MRRLLVTLLSLTAVGVAAGCGGGGDHSAPVAFVGTTKITSQQLSDAIEQLRADRRRKGEVEDGFPEPGTRGYGRMRDSILALLVFRAELDQAAERLGIHVSDDEVDRQLDAGGGAPGEEEGGALGHAARESARASLRAQLLYDRIYAKVTRGADPASRRASMARFIERMRRRAKVRYEPGYAPGS